MECKPLETSFVSRTFRFDQVKRVGDIAIYKKTALKGPIRSSDHAAGFEVIRIGRHNGYTIAGSTIEPAETYPSDSQWGIAGFTYKELDKAEARFNDMLKNQQVKKDKKSSWTKSFCRYNIITVYDTTKQQHNWTTESD